MNRRRYAHHDQDDDLLDDVSDEQERSFERLHRHREPKKGWRDASNGEGRRRSEKPARRRDFAHSRDRYPLH